MRFLLSILVTAMLVWMAGFAIYLARAGAPAADPTRQADALVVLTGGNTRVERGFALLAAGNAPVLLISGVGHHVTVAEMLNQHATPELRSEILARGGKIIFDYDASTTQTNAENTADFIRSHHYQRIRLITAHYHMPRSLLEFRTVLPGVEILPEPVVPEEFNHGAWWENPAARRLIMHEYHKYLAAHLRIQQEHGSL